MDPPESAAAHKHAHANAHKKTFRASNYFSLGLLRTHEACRAGTHAGTWVPTERKVWAGRASGAICETRLDIRLPFAEKRPDGDAVRQRQQPGSTVRQAVFDSRQPSAPNTGTSPSDWKIFVRYSIAARPHALSNDAHRFYDSIPADSMHLPRDLAKASAS
jgi:hypothetical protein